MIITIDGPVAAGKTSCAKRLAKRLGFTLLDTGAIYRSVAFAAKRAGLDWNSEQQMVQVTRSLDIEFQLEDGRSRVLVEGDDATEAIRQPEISRGASIVSAQHGVREALLALQRTQADKGDLIAEGRDTGTVVFPDAGCKFYLDAQTQERARRRYAELNQKGVSSTFAEVLQELQDRDHRDSTRPVAPLVRAADAIYVDSTSLDPEEVVARLLEAIELARNTDR